MRLISWMMLMDDTMWDIFICHAWEDKEEIARPLAEALQQAGLRVWYDKFELKVGDSLRQSINQGLRDSRYGVVILSPHFFEKQWAQKELNGLAAREREGKKVILPVWHKVHYEEILQFSPELADRLAISTDNGVNVVVQELLQVFPEKEKQHEQELGVQEFEFETVHVNARGEITHRERHTCRQNVEDLGNGVMLEMVYIPGGTFLMGSPEDEIDRGDDEFQHQVTVAPFLIGKYPVTQEQWQVFMSANPSHFQGAKRPVEQVSWHEAQEFCQRLSEKTGVTYRLPTEAEWEYACRAGTTTPFYFGETTTPEVVNYNGNYPYGSAPKGIYRKETTNVGIFPPNAFGLYDMHGNVWEWCLDWYGRDYYTKSPKENPRGPASGSSRVLRGGSWFRVAGLCRAANRVNVGPGNRLGRVGFRLLRTPS